LSVARRAAENERLYRKLQLVTLRFWQQFAATALWLLTLTGTLGYP